MKPEFFKNFVINLLKQGTVEVNFTKSDGTERTMKCTLKEDVVVPYSKKTDRTKETNNDIIPVFDVEKNEWRSFRVDSINTISPLDGQC